MKQLKIAVEYERGLHNASDFTVANVAPNFLGHLLNVEEKDGKKETKYFHNEGTLHQTEFNSQPASSLNQLCLDFLKAEELNDRLSAELGVVNIPISETGAGLAEINPAVMHRVHGYQTIFGKEAVQRLIRISGIHLHIDQYKERAVDQFNALTALRPTIAFTSTSAISHQRKNSMNCHRYHAISDPSDGVFATIPEERGYISSIEELIDRDQRRYTLWLGAFSNPWYRRNNPDLPLTYTVESFRKYFQPENTGYPDIRNRPDIGQGTFELRINDTAPLDLIPAQAGLVLGFCNRILLQDNLAVEIAQKDFDYGFEGRKSVLLPNIETLDYYLSSLAMQEGLELENREVRDYNQALLGFAIKGIPAEEQHYFDPYVEILNSGKNMASQILTHLGHKEQYSESESAQANKLVWEKHQQAMRELEQKIGYKRGQLLCAE